MLVDEGAYYIDTGVVELIQDRRNPSGWLLIINGLESSYIDLSDPTRLEFEYVSWMAIVIDLLRAPRQPVAAVHLGGGGCTLPRYVAATRPASPQIVFEIDRKLLQMVGHAFELHEIDNLKLVVGDALEGLRGLPAMSYDVIVRDTFVGGDVPEHLAGDNLLDQARRCLVTDGVYLANIPDEADLKVAEAEAALAAERFPHVALLVDPRQLRRRRFSNVVLVASGQPLPLKQLSRRLQRATHPARVARAGRVQ